MGLKMACKSFEIKEMTDAGCEPQKSLIYAKSALEVLTELTYELISRDNQNQAAAVPSYDEIRRGVLYWAEKCAN